MIIFYLPYKIDKNRPSTPNIRPLKLVEALQNYDNVCFISGPLYKRVYQTLRVVLLYRDNFFYWESSSTNLFASNFRVNYGLGFLDYINIFCLAMVSNRSNCFIRDVHWYFDEINAEWSQSKRKIYKLLGIFENWLFVHLAGNIFLPSLQMQKYLGVQIPNGKVVKDLPSGIEKIKDFKVDKCSNLFSGQSLRLLYVGGLSEVYNLRPLLALTKKANAELVICTRESDYLSHGEYIRPYLGERVKVVHAAGERLSDYYNWAHFGCLYFEPIEYHKFMMPYKLYEYALYNLPVLVSRQSKFGEVVKVNDIGLELEINVNEAAMKLSAINETTYCGYLKNIVNFIESNSWDSRAKTLIDG